MARASSSRRGLKSLAMTSEAPAARATPDREAPDGAAAEHEDACCPAPAASSTVWTALPMGSMMAPISVGMPSSFITLEAGIAM